MSWYFSSIGNHVEKISTWNPSQSLGLDAFKYIDLSSVDKDKKIISLNDIPLINPIEAPSRARQIVKAKDVLVATVRPNLNGVAVVPDELDGATASTGYCVLRTDNCTLDFRYLYHWVKTNSFVDEMIKKATGANYPAISDKTVKESKIPLPPLSEQKRIAAILDKADGIRRKRQQAIQLADEFLRSVFLELVGSPNHNPHGFPMNGLDYYFHITTGKLDANRAVEGGVYPFFTCSRGDYWIDDYAFDTEAILLAGNNANADYSVKHYKGKFNAYQRTYVMTLKNEDNSYPLFKVALEYKLNEMKRYSKGTNTKYLTLGILEDIKLPLPPPSIQNQFEAIYKKYIQQRNKQISNFHDTEICFASLSQRAFRGEL